VANLKIKHALVAVVLSSFLCTLATAGGVQARPGLTPKDENAIRKTVEEIRSAIATRNIDALLQHISPTEGLSCTDTNYTHLEAKKFLQDRSSVFYTSLFDTAKFRKDCGAGYPPEYPAISDQEFYAKATHEIVIEAADKNWGKVTIQSPIKSHYERWMYLHREHNSWKAAGGSFVIGNCTCGG